MQKPNPEVYRSRNELFIAGIAEPSERDRCAAAVELLRQANQSEGAISRFLSGSWRPQPVSRSLGAVTAVAPESPLRSAADPKAQ